jgi:hypothetical protein
MWNPGTQWAQAFAIGSNAANEGFNTGLRLQQLRSQRALQQLQERRLAQQLALATQQHDLMVQEQADMAKAMSRVQLQSQQMLPAPADGPPAPGGGLPTAMLPNPDYMPLDQSLLQNVLPVVAKYRPAETGNFLADLSRFRQEQWQPSTGTVTTPGGRTVEYFQGSPNNAYPIGGAGDVEITTTPEGEQFYHDLRGKPIRIPRDSEGRTLRVDDIKRLKDAPGGARLLEWDFKKGAYTLPAKNAEAAKALLAATSDITTSTRTDLEKSLRDVESGLSSVAQSERLIRENPDALGGVGIAKDLLSRTGRQLGLETDPRISKVRTRLGQNFTQVAEALRVGSGTMSDYEEKRLVKIGDPRDWLESDVTAADMIQGLKDILLAKKLRETRMLKGGLTDEHLLQIPEREVEEMYLMDALTEEEGQRLLKLLVDRQRITGTRAIEIYRSKPKG